ncbi:TPA: LGFP repeat-containing protein, partial [Streptococcus pneumoniae]
MWGGKQTKLASKCTRDYRVTTQSKVANELCGAYVGAANETAAQIIYKVGKACKISQKVLLVMLDKEQSLVSDPWPNEEQYFRAMGYACPDSGPGGTANCDPSQGGFFQQVYRAAWQLQYYKKYSNTYRYKPFQTNTIQWHPSLSCGTSQVYIENFATAALYIYTPYRPNQAALEAGTAAAKDPCASYGNRNFFNFYNKWFGSTLAQHAIVGGIKVIWDRAQAAGYNYGLALEERRWTDANGGGWEQRFERGVITESRALFRTFGLPSGSFSEAYLASGGASGPWGFLGGDPVGDTFAGTRAVQTQLGTLIFTLTRGVQYLPEQFHSVWAAAGKMNGAFGYPAETAVQRSTGGWSQRFENGSALMMSSGSPTVVSAQQLRQWEALGGYDQVGLYTSDAVVTGSKSYRFSERGRVFTNGDEPFYIANGLFLSSFDGAGGTSGSWGWPLGPKNPIESGISRIEFENGIAVHSPTYGLNFLLRAADGSPVPYLKDDTASPYTNEIRWMATKGITTGYPLEY